MNTPGKTAFLTALYKTTFLAVCLTLLSLPLSANMTKSDIQLMIREEARAQSFPSHLALAVAEVESGFDPYARSHVDARGVMQILPKTAAEDLGVNPDTLFNPRVNIKAGIAFLNHLISAYDGRIDIALSHYNGGSRVRQSDGTLKIIPATKNYVEKVLQKSFEYKNNTPFTEEKGDQNQPLWLTQKNREALDDFSLGDPLSRKTPELVTNKKVTVDKRMLLIHRLKELANHNNDRQRNINQLIDSNRQSSRQPTNSFQTWQAGSMAMAIARTILNFYSPDKKLSPWIKSTNRFPALFSMASVMSLSTQYKRLKKALMNTHNYFIYSKVYVSFVVLFFAKIMHVQFGNAHTTSLLSITIIP